MRKIIAIELGRGGHLVCPWASLKERPARTFPTAPTWSAPSRLHPWPWFLIIPGRKVGKPWRFVKVDLLAWLQGNEQMIQGAR